jgi:nitroreductase
MEFDKAVLSRRTCRDYSSKTLPVSKIADILDIARFSPSSGNLQNWQFIIVRDQEKKEKIADICNGQVWMSDAQAHLVVCNKSKEVEKEYPSRGKLYATQNCAIVSANIVLKAADKGVGSALVAAFDEYELQKLLDIPDDIIPEMIVTLGYPEFLDEDQPRIDLKYLCYFESWGKKEDKKDFWPISKHSKKLAKKATQAKNRVSTKAKGLIRKAKNKLKK